MERGKNYIVDIDKIYSISVDLANKVSSKYRGQKIDVVVGIARGGLFSALILADRLGAEFDSIRVKSYAGGYLHEPKLVSDVTQDLNGKTVVVVDDVSDRGETFDFVVNHIKDRYSPKDVKTASLFVKPWTKFTPDVYVSDTDSFIIFPWELKESGTLDKILAEE